MVDQGISVTILESKLSACICRTKEEVKLIRKKGSCSISVLSVRKKSTMIQHYYLKIILTLSSQILFLKKCFPLRMGWEQLTNFTHCLYPVISSTTWVLASILPLVLDDYFYLITAVIEKRRKEINKSCLYLPLLSSSFQLFISCALFILAHLWVMYFCKWKIAKNKGSLNDGIDLNRYCFPKTCLVSSCGENF